MTQRQQWEGGGGGNLLLIGGNALFCGVRRECVRVVCVWRACVRACMRVVCVRMACVWRVCGVCVACVWRACVRRVRGMRRIGVFNLLCCC